MLEKLIGKSWSDAMMPYLSVDYMNDLGRALALEYKQSKVFPPQEDIFNAFKLTPYDKVQVLCLSLDPYIREGQAYGVAFGVRESCIAIPASLRNIEKEVENDIYGGFKLTFDFTLEHWCKQGCFMYNTALTVVEGKTGSHLKLWSPFTKAVVNALNDKDFCIYILLGKNAQSYSELIVPKEGQYIITAPHPAAEAYAGGNAGFFGSKIFSKTNQILIENGRNKIEW